MSFANFNPFRIAKASATFESSNEKICHSNDNNFIISHNNTNASFIPLYRLVASTFSLYQPLARGDQ